MSLLKLVDHINRMHQGRQTLFTVLEADRALRQTLLNEGLPADDEHLQLLANECLKNYHLTGEYKSTEAARLMKRRGKNPIAVLEKLFSSYPDEAAS